ncbi:MAG: HVO_2523 family zinc finger protein [Halobacteriaceae archaeon]
MDQENNQHTADTPSQRSGQNPTCPKCNMDLYTRHCKYICPQHGVIYDCSDPFA